MAIPIHCVFTVVVATTLLSLLAELGCVLVSMYRKWKLSLATAFICDQRISLVQGRRQKFYAGKTTITRAAVAKGQ